MSAEPREIGCIGKERFTSFRLAARVARRQTKRHNARFEPYRCRHCGDGWHIGISEQRPKSEPRDRLSRAELLKVAAGAPLVPAFIWALCWIFELWRITP